MICAPAKPELASRRTPFPPAERYTSILPVSGWNPCAGSSVVMRHWIAYPRFVIVSCVNPSSGRLAPAAICDGGQHLDGQQLARRRVGAKERCFDIDFYPRTWICAAMMSIPVISSVTVCSTWIRGLISIK